MLRTYTAIILFAVATLFSPAGHADTNTVRKAFLARFPGADVESVRRMPVGGLYEIVSDGQIVYTDEKMDYLLSGSLFDLRGHTERNLTRERTMQITAHLLVESRGNAIKRVKGNGKRVLYTFEDPNCGYCKALQKELDKIGNVTIYTFLWPILSPSSVDKSAAIWCAKDRARAWEAAMTKAVIPPAPSKACKTPLRQNSLLARRFGIQGTPAIYLANGEQIGGYVSAARIEQALNTVTR